MTCEESELISMIEAAWQFVSAPTQRISVETYDDEGTHEYFWKSDWRDHTPKQLKEHHAALSFFTAEAYHYYLPAFVKAAITNPGDADVLLDGIIFSLERVFLIDDSHDVTSLFSQQQMEALASYVEYTRDHPASKKDDTLIQRLRSKKEC
jgi:hypothetical protein